MVLNARDNPPISSFELLPVVVEEEEEEEEEECEGEEDEDSDEEEESDDILEGLAKTSMISGNSPLNS